MRNEPPKNNRLKTSYVLICITSLFRISHDGITLNSVTATAVLERREAVHLATRLSLYYIIILPFFWQSLFSILHTR